MKIRKSVLRIFLCAVLVFGMVCQGSLKASAINTVFMVPPIDATYVHHNTIYLSPNYNITAIQSSYGTNADILNTTGNISALLAELNANVTPTGDNRIIGMYMEGAGLSDANAATIRNGGWNKVEMYYDTYFVAGLPNGAMHPNIQLVDNESIRTVLGRNGFENEFAVLEVTGVNSSWAYLIKYDPGLAFLHGTDVHVYKYQPDLAVFLEVEEVYFDSYDTNFMEWDNPELVDPEINGFYVAVGEALPEAVVCTPDEAAELRANPPVVSNIEGNVLWKMVPGLIPENFTAEAVVEPASETEVSVSFEYSGELPEGTEVTVQIPQETVTYAEGAELYLYYCNPDTGLREFVSSGTYAQQQVTFAIYHCSDYVITSENHGESYLPEPEVEETTAPTEETTVPPTTEPETIPATEVPTVEETQPAPEVEQPGLDGGIWIAVAAVVVAAAVVAVVLIRKKKK